MVNRLFLTAFIIGNFLNGQIRDTTAIGHVNYHITNSVEYTEYVNIVYHYAMLGMVPNRLKHYDNQDSKALKRKSDQRDLDYKGINNIKRMADSMNKLMVFRRGRLLQAHSELKNDSLKRQILLQAFRQVGDSIRLGSLTRK